MYDKSEKDDFWSVDKLIPAKKKTIPAFSTKEKTVSIKIEGKGESKADNKLTFDTYKPTDEIAVSEYSYSPEYTTLIKKVEIKPSYDKYDFFDTFDLDDSELETEYTTVGGWCIEMLDGVVSEADHFEYEHLYIIVSKMKDMRILSLTVVENEKEDEE